jgi:2-methylaconitate cis-trans-isomerase PrpF
VHGTDTDALTTATREQTALPFVLMRGGTSKALVLRAHNLPSDPVTRDRAILSLFGSPDPRQIDGLGGADILTSKLAIIDAPSRPDADLDYTFAQISITEPVVDYDINCGNISAAVGSYAIDEGIVAPTEPETTVRIHNTNTGRLLLAHVPVVNGMAAVEGAHAVHGVPGTGAPIALDFGRTAGGITGSLLPTGNVIDTLDTTVGPVAVTIVDLANLTLFFSAASIGMDGTEGPAEFTKERLVSVAAVKEAACRLLDMPTNGLIPVPALVSSPKSYVSYATGQKIDADDVDLVARVVGGRPAGLHKAYPGTLAACTGVAALMEGTTVHNVVRKDRVEAGDIVIGHTSGVMPVEAAVSGGGNAWTVEKATYLRTARRLAEGTAYLRRSALEHGDETR